MKNKRELKTLKARKERFIQLGKAKHGNDRYGYSQASIEYINNRTPVHIICNKCKIEPFLVYPFAHTDKGDNRKGTCPHCYKTNLNVKETRWDPNLKERIRGFKASVVKKYKHRYSYPHLEKEYKNESSKITVVCNQCGSSFKRLARSLKSKSRYGGCKICNKEVAAEKTRVKNKKRQLRNHRTKDIPRKKGFIYKVTNTKNGKFYIGYTNKSIKERLKGHYDESVKLSRGNKKAKSYLHNAMNHHGFEYFKIEILEEHTEVTPYYMAELEMEYIAKFKPHYNVTPGGEIGRSKLHLKKAS
jgi:hypothetical protein